MILPTDTLLAGKEAIVLLWLILVFAVERLWPAAPMPAALADAPAGRRQRLGRNGVLWLANVALSPLVVLPLTAWAASRTLPWRPAWWAGWPALAGDIVLLDFLIYWWHRANHQWPLLWRFHEVHHLDRFLDSTTALRFHFGEVLISAGARALVIILVGVPFATVMLFEALLLCATIFHHSNLRLPPRLERALARLIVTPSIHWVHHHAVRTDTDANYSTIFSLWDRLLGTRSPTARQPTMPIGVAGETERALPALLVRPFRAVIAGSPAARP
jgi:sterol desaturase/sphingolipid hydroxylase (fatty acid hydroxylase superfamily)